ncbi:hypothetical protein [Mycobacterium lepromatosis]|uniref:hypothetical protein n=1 Tax=Mycobacterium lepromatosis TaxID=480418 RepID=UPI0006791066|nr:hypothetical protein [Mycobacterium lepromatosis]
MNSANAVLSRYPPLGWEVDGMAHLVDFGLTVNSWDNSGVGTTSWQVFRAVGGLSDDGVGRIRLGANASAAMSGVMGSGGASSADVSTITWMTTLVSCSFCRYQMDSRYCWSRGRVIRR